MVALHPAIGGTMSHAVRISTELRDARERRRQPERPLNEWIVSPRAHKFRNPPHSRGTVRLAGAVVAAQGDAAFAPPHTVSTAALVARAERRRTDTSQNALVAIAAAPFGGGLADPGLGRSAFGPQSQTGGHGPAGAGGGQWLDRRKGLGCAAGTDCRPAAPRPRPPRGRFFHRPVRAEPPSVIRWS